jgi:hypothetical protein
VDRISVKVRETGENILVYGDYDVMEQIQRGARFLSKSYYPNVMTYIPDQVRKVMEQAIYESTMLMIMISTPSLLWIVGEGGG